MKSIGLSILALMIATALALAPAAGAQTITMVVDANKTNPAISPLMYGYFTELLGNMYEGGPWAEMLGDRKFFYPVDSKPSQTPPNSRRFVGRWQPVGPDEFVTMDTRQVWVGKHSPLILWTELRRTASSRLVSD